MKVLQINGVYGHGSTGTIVRDIENLCEQSGIECYVASPDPNVLKAKRGYLIGGVLDHKLHALLCRINGQQAYFSHCATLKLIKHIETINPDIVHLHNIHGNYMNLSILLSTIATKRIRTIITMHDCWFFTGGCFHYSNVQCYKWQQNCGNCPKKKVDTPAYFFDKSSQILADRKRLFDAIPNLTVTGVSNWICEESKKGIFRDKNVITVHNGIDVGIFKPTTLEEIDFTEELKKLQTYLNGHFTILGLARKWLDPINKEAFLYILNQMHSSDYFLLFGCNDDQISAIDKLSISKEQRKRIVTFGYTNNRHQLAALYSLADVFINCTREESFSLINVEPQACGTPVVTYANTGAQETVDNKCSYGVKTGDYCAMWIMISLIRKNGKEHYSEDCIKWVKNNFEMQNNFRNYIQLYNNYCR